MQVNCKVVEHFGFADNISQPLFFEKDVAKHMTGSGRRAWDSSAGPNLVLVQDPYGGANACGSYLVFLKLEQNVRDFALKVQDLALQFGTGGRHRPGFHYGAFSRRYTSGPPRHSWQPW